MTNGLIHNPYFITIAIYVSNFYFCMNSLYNIQHSDICLQFLLLKELVIIHIRCGSGNRLCSFQIIFCMSCAVLVQCGLAFMDTSSRFWALSPPKKKSCFSLPLRQLLRVSVLSERIAFYSSAPDNLFDIFLFLSFFFFNVAQLWLENFKPSLLGKIKS